MERRTVWIFIGILVVFFAFFMAILTSTALATWIFNLGQNTQSEATEAASQVPTVISPALSATPLGVLNVTPIPTASLQSNPTPDQTPPSLAHDLIQIATSTPLSSRLQAWCLPWNQQPERGNVKGVIDGTKIEVEIGGEVLAVRYIGIETPDSAAFENYEKLVLEKNKDLVAGENVLLFKDQGNIDDQGNLWRYVIADGIFVNLRLVESGYAVATSQTPNIRCDDLFLSAQQRAVASQHGLWAPTPTPTSIFYWPSPTPTVAQSGEVVISFIAPKGSIWQEPEEFVEIHSTSNEPIQLEGWTLSNQEGHTFIFPEFIMQPGWHCRVYTNEFHPTSCGFSFERPSPVWDNQEDCAYLRNALGEEIDRLCY